MHGFVVHRQIPGCYSEVRDYIMCSKGNGLIGGRGPAVQMTGETEWKRAAAEKDMYQVEHNELFASIRNSRGPTLALPMIRTSTSSPA